MGARARQVKFFVTPFCFWAFRVAFSPSSFFNSGFGFLWLLLALAFGPRHPLLAVGDP
jgi:hypothetical protein